MNKLALYFLCVFFISSISAYEVLEDIGESYPIGDSDMLSEMKKEYDKIDKKKLKNELIERIKEKLVANNNLPFCRENRKIKIKKKQGREEFIFEDFDIRIKKNDRVDLENVGFEKFFVLNTENKKELEWLVKKAKRDSKILISKGNIETKTLEGYNNRFILDKTLIQTAQIKCTPTILIISGDDFYLEEIDITSEE